MHPSLRAFAAAVFVVVMLGGLPSQSALAGVEPPCEPAIGTSNQTVRRADGVTTDIDVTTAATASVAQGDRLVSVAMTRANNATVHVDGKQVSVPATIPLASLPTWTFRVHRLDPTRPFLVEYVVRDRCGEVPRFVGVGAGDVQRGTPEPTTSTPTPATGTPAPSPSTTVTTTATTTTTAIPTAPATTTATGTPTTPTPTLGPVDPAGRITPQAAHLTTTFNSIGIELPFIGDPNKNATATLAFRRTGDSAWRAGLPLWQTTDPSGFAFYGSALLLDAGTPYEVQLTVADPDGVDGAPIQTATVTTRAESITAPEELMPSHFVRATGSDTNDGRSIASAWKTVDKAVKDAPSGAVVQVGAGYYATAWAKLGNWSTARTNPLTLVAEYPAIGEGREAINLGRRSVIEPAGISSPTGATDGPNPGVWQRETVIGPKTGSAFSVWRWAGSPVASVTQLGYASARADAPIRVAHWKNDTIDLATPAGWAEKLYTNLTYTYGFYSFGQDLYLRLPGDLDPNTVYVTASNSAQAGLATHGPGIRVSGFEIRQFASGVDIMWNARNTIVDHNLLTGNLAGVLFRGQPSTYGSNHVVQDNVIQDASLWSVDPAQPAIPWMFIKSSIRNADGSDYPTSKVGANSETSAVTGRGGALRVVVRRNTIVGTFDGVRNGYNEGYDRYASQDMDVYDNQIRHIADDALEPELAAINFRAWNNQFDESLTVLSTGPVKFGPVYLFLNTAWRTGNDGTGKDGQGRVPGSTMFKYSGKSDPAARVYVLQNTFWTDRASVSGGAQYASVGALPERFYVRNTLIRATQYAFDAPTGAGSWDEDGNVFTTAMTTRGLRYNGVIYTSNVQAYRDVSGSGRHTNLAAGFTSDVALRNPEHGDLRLPPGSPLSGAGVSIPNISDLDGPRFSSDAQDIGSMMR